MPHKTNRLVHSYSAVKTYEQCGLKYYRLRVLKDVKDKGTTFTAHGDNVHKALEENLKYDRPIPKELAAHRIVTAAVKRGIDESKNLGVEQNLGLDANFHPTGYWDNDIYLRVKLDILVTGGPVATVLDWKTGKRRPDFTQLKIAAITVLRSYEEAQEVRAGFVWLQDQAIDKDTYTREDLPWMEKELRSRIEAIEEAQETNVWTPKPSYLCRYCPARETCPYAEGK